MGDLWRGWEADKKHAGISAAASKLSTVQYHAVVQSYDGDGITDVAVYRPSTASFYALRSSNGTLLAFQFGVPGDMPLSGDYDGDGITDIAVYRPSTASFYALRSSNGTLLAFQFGEPGDIPLSGDYDGDGITDLAAFRPSTATFYALRTSNGTLLAFAFGAPGDIPLSGDYDGDGITDVAVYRPSTNTLYALRTSNGILLALQFGSSGDIPLSAYGATSIQITGQVTAGGPGVPGVTVTLSGDISTSTTTDANGNYSFSVPAGGTYTVAPPLAGYTFMPITFSNVVSNETNVDFTSGPFWAASQPGRWVKIVNLLSGKVLEVPAQCANSTECQVDQSDWTGAPQQQWQIVPVADTNGQWANIVNKLSGYLLDLPSQCANNTGCIIQQSLMDNAADQEWQLIPTAPGYSAIANASHPSWTGVLDVIGGSTADGTQVQQWSLNDNPQQQWAVISVDDGSGQTDTAPDDPDNYGPTIYTASVPAYSPNPCSDISGSWADSSNPNATWSLSQSEMAVSGSVTSSYGPGDVTPFSVH